jgi:hypothetical protein
MSTYDTPETARYDRASHVDIVERRPIGDAGAEIFIWVAWTLAFAFWALTMSTSFGILSALNSGAPDGVPGGATSLALVVAGVVVVGALLIWAMTRWSGRGRGMDAATEASTAALYNGIERHGGDELVSRGPGARKPTERDSYRPA